MTRLKRRLVVVAAFLALPFLLLAAIFGPLYSKWVKSRARKGVWGYRRSLTFSLSEGLGFCWMARSEGEARAALEDATAILVDLLPSVLTLERLDRLRIENPAAGFVVRNSALAPITNDFSAALASHLDDEHAEYATLIVNERHRLELDVDARSFVSGHLAVVLPAEPNAEELRTAIERYQNTPGTAQASSS